MLGFLLLSLVGVAGASFISFDNDPISDPAPDVADPSSEEEEEIGLDLIDETNDDVLTGGDGSDSLSGEDGNDSVFGMAGNDVLYGGDGDDYLDGNAGDDWMDLGDGDDQAFGGAGNDRIIGYSGNNEIFGGAGRDNISGSYEADAQSTLSGGWGNDTIRDGDGDAEIFGGNGSDVIVSGHGESIIYGGTGNDDIESGIDTDVIYGDEGDDHIKAIGSDTEGEADLVYGGAGDDVLSVRGSTEAYGGSGADHFQSYANTWVTQAPVIADFDPNEDTLEVELDSHEFRQQLEDFDIEINDFTDGTGASIFVDGTEVMRIPGAQGLSVSDVQFTLV